MSQWEKFWTQAYYPTSQDRLYRPLTSMSYAIEWRIFGDRPWVFHLINVLLYAANCAAVAELARRLGGLAIGYFAGLLFAVHPVHVEAVAYIVGRAELLSTGAMLWAMILAAGDGFLANSHHWNYFVVHRWIAVQRTGDFAAAFYWRIVFVKKPRM